MLKILSILDSYLRGVCVIFGIFITLRCPEFSFPGLSDMNTNEIQKKLWNARLKVVINTDTLYTVYVQYLYVYLKKFQDVQL